MTAQANVTEILARLNNVLTPTAYDLGGVPSPRPPEFAELTLSRRFGGVMTLGGHIGTTGYRFTVAAVSQVSVANARNTLERVRAEFEFTTLAVGSQISTPIQFETEDEADYGSGWFAQYLAMTYVL